MPINHEQRTRITDSLVLSRYLPAAVVNRVLEADAALPAHLHMDEHVARLQELLQIVVSYVPEYAGLAQGALPATKRGVIDRVHGTLLAADLSGFTAFSERLSTLGSEGAELVARTISDLFSSQIAALSGWGGNLLKLSGDALTALFSGPNHAQRAVAAALELQARMDAFQELVTPAGIFTLRLRLGLASGEVLLVEVGTNDRVELLVAGGCARHAAENQRRAAPGAVVIGSSTYHEIAPSCQALTVGSGLYRVLAIDPPERPPPAAPMHWQARRDQFWELHALIGRLEALRPYLVDQHLAQLAAGPPSLAGEGDLRPVSVLFACLSDAGPTLERAAAGDTAAVEQLQTNAQRIWNIVERYGGTINKLDLHAHGHTLVALFGAPVAQGRDAERAVNCALALIHDCAEHTVNQGNTAEPLLVRRIGLTTGHVFAGAVGSTQRREYTVMGSVVNLAARLMDVAEDRQVLIGDTTAQAVHQRFHLQKQPPVSMKGFARPIPFYLVGPEQRSRLSMLLREQGPLIGREEELARARASVEQALAGQGTIVALVGEAGIGKSRLLAAVVRSALIENPGMSSPTIIMAQAQPHSRGQPYAVITALIRRLYDLPDHPEQAVRALAAQINKHAPEHERFLPLLLTMLGLPGENSPITQALTPDERRARLHGLFIALLAAHATDWPTALLLEDLHWSDRASLDLLGELAVACLRLPLLILCTYRSDDSPEWPEEAATTRVQLRGLTPEQSQQLLDAWMDGRALADELRARALDLTQGNPFFIEETARTLRDRDHSVDDAPPLPATVQGALLARLDRLRTEERYVLQIASVIGPQFKCSLLASLTGKRVSLHHALEQLVRLGLLRLDNADEDRYAFAHSLTQQTAYESLLFSQRRKIHRHVAIRLLAEDPEVADNDPGLVALHYRRAEAWPETLEWSWRAGARAQALYASDVALSHYQTALEAVERLDRHTAAQWGPAILRRCGDLHALAGRYTEAVTHYQAAIAASRDNNERAEILIGWAEVCEKQAAYTEALSLLDRASTLVAEDNPLLLRICVRRGWILVRQGTPETARAAVEPCLERLEERQLWADLLLGYKVFFHIALGQCRWSEARSYLRLALTCAEHGGDIREIARIHNNLGVVLLHEGRLHAAAESFERCGRVMEDIGDRYGLALIKGNTGVIYYKLGDTAAALDLYNASLRTAQAIGAPHPESIVRNNLGELYRHLGRLPESLEQLLRSVELCQQTHDNLGLAEAYRQLAETYIALDRLVEADQACEQALAAALAADDRQYQAIVYRVRGQLAATHGDYDTALEDTLRSIRMLTDLGSTQELGQSMIVQASILQHEGQIEAACAVLEEAIRLFRKAGAHADLVHAEQLLDDIRAHVPTEEVYP